MRKDVRWKKWKFFREIKKGKRGFWERSKNSENSGEEFDDKFRELLSSFEEEGSDRFEFEIDVEDELRFKWIKMKEVFKVFGRMSDNNDGEFEFYFKDMFL